MPFERSFYAGGANGMRGWQFRELGPGSYNGSDDVERIGDIQLEGNFEYRFPIYSFVKGALFTDVGNIWTISESNYLPGGKFDINNFYKELAMDAGLGLRFDFSFFIFRADFALPLRDPARSDGDRWMIHKLQLSDTRFNFGIGYPF
jgi:outer membrane protein assembly factor BamA